jgi:hypothetical protein
MSCTEFTRDFMALRSGARRFGIGSAIVTEILTVT